MGHRLDFVDLQKPKVRGPPMRLEQRIMIRTEMSRRAPALCKKWIGPQLPVRVRIESAYNG